jgi:hypothetical protein
MLANVADGGSSRSRGNLPRGPQRTLRSLPRGRRVAAVLALALVLAGALLAALGGGGGSHSSSPAHAIQALRAERAGEVRAAAHLLGLGVGALRRELLAGRSLAEVAAAHGVAQAVLVERLVAAKRAAVLAPGLDPTQRAARIARLKRTVEASVRRRSLLAEGVNVPVAARYLGLTIPALRAGLSRGSTLAQLAAATPGRSAGGLVSALVSARRRTLAAMVANGAITKAQQSRMLSTFAARIEAIVRRAAPPA